MKRRQMIWIPAFTAIALGALIAGPIVAQDDDDPASKSVSLEISNQTLLDALKLLFKSVGANFVLEPGVQRGAANVKVDLSITNQPFLQALENVLAVGTQKGAGLTYRLENGVYTITTKDGAGGAVPAATPNPVRPPRIGGGGVSASKSRVSLALKGEKLDDALRSVFDAADTQFVIPLRAPATETIRARAARAAACRRSPRRGRARTSARRSPPLVPRASGSGRGASRSGGGLRSWS